MRNSIHLIARRPFEFHGKRTFDVRIVIFNEDVMKHAVESRSPSPIDPSRAAGETPAAPVARPGGPAESRRNDGPLSGLSRRPDHVSQRAGGPGPSQTPTTSRSQQTGSIAHSRTESFGALRDEINAATDIETLHRLTGRVPGEQTISPSNEHAAKELLLAIGGKMSEAMTRINPNDRSGINTTQLGQCISAFSRMRPSELAAAGVYQASTLINIALPRDAQQAVFDRSLAVARNISPGNRGMILIALQTAIFRFPEPATPDSLCDARSNLSNIAKSSDGIPSAELKQLVEKLAAHPKLLLLALNEGNWQSAFNAIVDASSRLSPGDRQEVRNRLGDSLDTIEQNIGPAGIDAARQHLKTLEPRDA